MITSATLVADLRAIVGDRHVIDGRSSLLVYESDASPGYRKRPSLAVFPGSRDEAIAVGRVLAERGLAFVARGSGTGLSGGALADGVALLGLQRLKRIIALDPVARTATVEAGVVNAALTSAAAPHGLHYAPDPSSQTACTIGGNVAENAGGPHCLKYGVTLNHILAATVMLPDGRIVPLRIPRGAPDGYDLMGAFVGSEGCFGVALDITVRLTPTPQSVRTLLADFMTVDGAARTTSAIVASGIVPAACELMDQGTIRAVEASIYAAGYPTDAAAVLLIEVDGASAMVDDDAARVEAICRDHDARSIRIASDPADRARLWHGRKKAFGAMGRMAPDLSVQDAVVPRTRLAAILAAIAGIAAKHRVQVCNVFHAGDGNLHPNISYNGRDPDETARVHAANREIMALCIAAGGTITGEHGVGLDKIGYMEQLFPPDTLDAMCRLRAAFDPDRRANPGKVVPVRVCREWAGRGTQEQQRQQEQATDDTRGPRTDAARSVVASGGPEQDLATRIKAASRLQITGAGSHVRLPAGRTDAIDVLAHHDVIEYVPGDLTITVGAGMTLAELDAITAGHRQWCPLLPWGTDAGTIGGALAIGAGGVAAAALGAPRDLALGLTFVDGLGCIVSAGGRVVKNVAGFDLTRAMIGSRGTLGIITAASLRLRARPVASETWIVQAGAVNGSALTGFLRGPYAPIACEHVTGSVATALGEPDDEHVILWLAGGAAQVKAAREALLAIADAHEIGDDAWATVRARGPSATPPAPSARSAHQERSPVLAALNARVKAAFDPGNIFGDLNGASGNE